MPRCRRSHSTPRRTGKDCRRVFSRCGQGPVLMTIDWDDWARRAEKALDMETGGNWRGMFAAGATFADPNTTTATSDLQSISRDTRKIFPDWRQEITSIRGGD